MTAADLLARIRDLGIDVVPDGGNLRYRAPAGRLTSELRAELAAAKPALIAILTGPAECNLGRANEGLHCQACGYVHGKLEPRPPCDACGATDQVVMVVGIDGGRYCRTCRRIGGPPWGADT